MAWLLWSLGGLPDRPEGVRYMVLVAVGFNDERIGQHDFAWREEHLAGS
jgi:hypothetical protein